MKTSSFLIILNFLLIFAFILPGCNPKTPMASTETSVPIPTIQPTPHTLDLKTTKSVCILVSGANTEGVNLALTSLMQVLNYQVASSGETCDATIDLQMDGQPLSASYQVNNTSEYRECFTGGQFTGAIQLTGENAIPQSIPVNETLNPPSTIVDICPNSSEAPYKAIWSKILINNFQKLMGDKVYAAAQQVEGLRGQYEWIGNGPYSSELVENLIGLLDNGDPWTRWYAAQTLSFLRPVPVESIPALLKRIGVEQSRQPDVSSHLWIAIQNAGPGAAPLLPNLIEIMGTSTDAYTRQMAMQTIGKIGKSTSEITAVLVKALSDSEPLVRMNAARSLGIIKAPLEESARPLIAALSDSDTSVRQAAGQALVEITNHTESDPENAEAWLKWLDTPPTPTPVITQTPEVVLKIKAPEEFLIAWHQFNGKYVVYVHKEAKIKEFSNLDGLNWYIGFIGINGQIFDKQAMGQDVAKLAGLTSVHMNIISMESPDEFVDYMGGNPDGNDIFKNYFLGRPDFVGFMLPEVAHFYQFDNNPDLVRVDFE